MIDTIVTGGMIVLPDSVITADLALQNGKIAAIGNKVAFSDARNVVRAEGCYVFPGAIPKARWNSSDIL